MVLVMMVLLVVEVAGGFRDEALWSYHYLGEPVYFTVGEDVSQRKIDEANRQKELEQQEKQTEAIKENTETNKNGNF